ncbi:glutathione S-transferase family protein [Fischerella sp. PCC 9605]|uniref:glutathione S-transferase family protein n=1 Tax=Fischerella sp. PCC 9605 TaxID=1173024 RepID=UPI0004B46482|nr:glutathione S-transferase C-terminal domain-containing protein [Fischerella sp. PCC 9605]
MKLLLNGVWHCDFQLLEGERIQTGSFRDVISADGSSRFQPEPDRYHLYVSFACPFAHRTILARQLKRLENVISMSVLSPDWGDPNGWIFGNWDNTTPDTVNGCDYLHQVYIKAKPDFTGRVTVPVLWDKKTGTIVNNESADILRMLATEFDAFGNDMLELYPKQLKAEIDQINAFVSGRINIGVYKVGFASSQADYDVAIEQLFDALDTIEARLTGKQYLVSDRLTEADIRLFVTLVRFDVAYYGALNCNLRHLTDYPNLWNYTRHIYHLPNVAQTVKFDHIKRHYYDTYEGMINRRIVPKGPLLDWDAPSLQACH